MKSYLLTNSNGMQAEVLSFGANIRRLVIPDVHGHPVNVVIGFFDPEMYRTDPRVMGGAIGPVCSLTENARFTLNGETWRLSQNNGLHNLHSDLERGFHKREWQVESADDTTITLTLHASHLDLGFPGERDVTLTYRLTEDNALQTDFLITSDRATYVNPTTHPYFNLDGETGDTILRHRVRFCASRFLPYNETVVPSGEIRDVFGTPFDFSGEKEIGKDIATQEEQLRLGDGYDHHFVIDDADGSLRPFATVTSPVTGISMEVSTTLPGFQFYTGNSFSCPKDCAGRTRGVREAFCIESSYPPNIINMPAFTLPVCDASHPYRSTTVYRFF